MNSSRLLFLLFLSHLFTFFFPSSQAAPLNNKLFREYIGAEGNGVRFSDVPISPNVEFHFILSFGIDYTFFSPPSPTNGRFNVFWDTENLSPAQVSSIKKKHSNVKVALSLGGDTVDGRYAYFQPWSVDSWVQNAVSSLTEIIKQYNLDGVDIDYEHFNNSDPNTFAECIGRLLTTLKQKGVIKFASIAPYDDPPVQIQYLALWKKYSHVIDYVNFQFYAYAKGTSISEFLKYVEIQSSNYEGGRVLVSFGTDKSGGLKPYNGFFDACRKLKSGGNLHGIFVWSADDSKSNGGFRYETEAQVLLSSPRCSVQPYLPCGGNS